MISKLIGWLGFSLGMFISIPQVIKSIRTRSTQGVSKLTYILLLLACVCYIVRAMAIKETIFIVSNAFQIIVAGTMLYLMRKYRRIIKGGFRMTYGKFKSVDLGKHWEFDRKEIYDQKNPNIEKIKKASEDLDAKS